MSFLYPRTMTLARAAAQAGEGQIGYGGKTQAAEMVIAQDIPCTFDLRREGQKDTTGLPGDGTRPTYDCRIPRRSLALGMVQDRDIVIDDQGLRYLVVGPFWASLGYALRVELLAA
jgi:hypothetical protein